MPTDSDTPGVQASDAESPPLEETSVTEPAPSGVCPNCQASNNPGEEFCGHCGTELIAGDCSDQQTPVASELSSEQLEEYKFLTVSKMPIEVQSSGLTDVGLVKDNNEDAFIVQTVEYPEHKIAVHVAIVADGMGGEPAGEAMAEIAVHEIWLGIRFLLPYFEQQQGFEKWEFWQFLNTRLKNHLTAQVASANSRIVRYGAAKKFKKGEFGATIVLAVVVCDLETGHVILHGYNEGDARCALVIENDFSQLSHDHTIGPTPFRFLGRHDHIAGQSFRQEFWFSEVDFTVCQILLYSDGLWNMLSKDQILDQTREWQYAEGLCNALIDQSLKVITPAGLQYDERVTVGDDNVTVATILVKTKDQISKGDAENHD